MIELETVFAILTFAGPIVTWVITHFVGDEKYKKLYRTFKEVVSFFDPEKPMSATSIETITNVIPANSYKITEESLNRVLETCDSEDEKLRIWDTVNLYEMPTSTGDECCEYTLDTSHATYRVQWGVPELIKNKDDDYKYLSTSKLSEICDLLGKENEFLVLNEIMQYEREHVREYVLEYNNTVIIIKDGEFSITT